jgi:hypothetical protein
MSKPEEFNVTAIPNESKIHGQLIDITSGPEGMGYVWKIKVDGSSDVKDLPNLTRMHIGKIITIYVHPGLKKQLAKADTIEARVSFQGDAQGGAFFLLGDDVCKL